MRFGAVFSAAVLLLLCVSIAPARAADPRGTWLIDQKAAVQVYDCGAALCARIVWLREPQDRFGGPKRDIENPDPSLRDRPLCGMTVLSGLRPSADGSWEGGAFYNPDDGRRYRANVELRSDDMLVARFYVGMPLLGENRTLQRLSGPGEPRDRSCGARKTDASAQAPGEREGALSLR